MFSRVLSCFGGLLLAFAVSAQETDTVIRATSRLVEISVTAQDKHGNPIRDLKRGDFALTDNKQNQNISVFLLNEPQPSISSVAPNREPLTNRQSEDRVAVKINTAIGHRS